MTVLRRNRPKTERERLAEQTVALGALLRPPTTSPFRALACSCERCGLLRIIPPTLVLRAAGALPECARCRDTRNAEHALRKGRLLHPPISSPFRVLAYSCDGCGALRSTPPSLIGKDSGTLPKCPTCARRASADYAKRQRSERNEQFLRRERRNVAATRRKQQVRTADAAHNTGKEWTGPELEVAARADLSAVQVATLLGRTLYSVKHMRRNLRKDPRTITLAGLR